MILSLKIIFLNDALIYAVACPAVCLLEIELMQTLKMRAQARNNRFNI